jgi:hypothetical protein
VPDFRATFTSGTTLAPWTDPAGDRPSRQNTAIDRGHLRQLATVGAEVELTANVDGVAAPMDAALDGRLFLGMFAEWASPSIPGITSPAGQGSVQRFTPAAAGHYCFVLRRDGGGGIYFHLDVVD